MKLVVRNVTVAAALALVLGGCMTDAERRAERINQNQVLYMQLDQATQSRVAQGLIAIGDTPSAVWLALGEPSKRTSDTTAVLVPDPPPPGVRPPPPGYPVPSHYETRTRYVNVVSLQIQFDNGRVSRIQQF